jgi:hypothetical protein
MMKNTIITFLALILIFRTVFCQDKIDTIRVNNNIAVTCRFNSPVIENGVIYGNNPSLKYFEHLINGNTVILRSKTEISPIITVTFLHENDDAEVCFLMYDKNATKPVYNFRKKEVIKIDSSVYKVINPDSIMYMTKLHALLASPIEYTDIGTKKNEMEFQISKIRNDPFYTYIELIINNQSGGAFYIDGVIFSFEEGKSRNLKKGEKKRKETLYPKYESDIKVVNAYSKSALGYVIPLFNIQEKGQFIINVKEKGGTRDYRIEIEADVMLKVKVF